MIGRNWLADEKSSGDEYYLSEFVDMAVDPDDLAEEPEQVVDYLSFFIAHASEQEAEPAEREEATVVRNGIAQSGVEIKFSKFISSYSELDASTDISLIRFAIAQVPETGMGVLADNTSMICYVLSGEGEIIMNGRGIRCRKYDCAWVDCTRAVEFRAYPGKPWECAFIRINGKANSALYSEAYEYLRANRLVYMTFGAGTRFRSVIWEMFSLKTSHNPNSEVIYSHLLLSLLTEINLAVINSSQKQTIVPALIVAIQGYLDRNYAQSLSLDMLSKTFNISKYHMSREFKRYIGKSPNEYIIDVRLNKAKEMLSDSDRTIADIGQLVGIPNTNHFLYLFKDREGMTPSAFRKRRL